jgi:hypothetical protein
VLSLLFSLSLFPFRPGAFTCEVKTVRAYYAYNRCFQGDVVTGVRWDGYQMLLTCETLKMVCPKKTDEHT